MTYMRHVLLIFILFLGCHTGSTGSQTQLSLEEKEIIARLNKQVPQNLMLGDRVIEIGKLFIGHAYEGHTLDKDSIERLVVNLTSFDCVTFVESVLSLALSKDEQGFITNLERLRYRKGVCKGYLSRLHYFSEWLLDNEQLGYLKAVDTGILAHEYTPDIGYMSKHTEKYPLLRSSLQRVDSLRVLENQLKHQKLMMVQQEDINKLGEIFHNGDLIAIVTNIPHLDITHTGFAVKEHGELRFMHASSDKHKVLITQNSLHDYVNSIAHMIGIIVYRPVM